MFALTVKLTIKPFGSAAIDVFRIAQVISSNPPATPKLCGTQKRDAGKPLTSLILIKKMW